jgi:hypothetical protein
MWIDIRVGCEGIQYMIIPRSLGPETLPQAMGMTALKSGADINGIATSNGDRKEKCIHSR